MGSSKMLTAAKKINSNDLRNNQKSGEVGKQSKKEEEKMHSLHKIRNSIQEDIQETNEDDEF